MMCKKGLIFIWALSLGVNAAANETLYSSEYTSGPQYAKPASQAVASSWKDKLFYEFSGRFGLAIERPLDGGGAHLGNTFSYSGHFGVGIQTRGENYWEAYFGYPRYGLRVAYTLYSGSVLGDYISLYPFIEGPIFRAGRFSLEYGLGFGVSCHMKKSDPVTNPRNYDIHTRFTGYVEASLLAGYQLTDHFDVFGGVNFVHNSNARLHRPNRGTNVPSILFGLRYHLNPRLMSQWYRDVPKPEYPKNEIYTSIAPFLNAEGNGLGQRYHFCSTWEVGYFRRLHPCMKAGAAMDLFYVDGYKDYRNIGGSNWNNLTLGLCGSFEIMFGRVSCRVAVGYVVVNQGAPTVDVYERFGAYYNFGRNTKQFAGLTVKALRGKAEFLELTYGITLWRF